MTDFTSDFQSFNIKHPSSFPLLLDIPNMDHVDQFTNINPNQSFLDYQNLNNFVHHDHQHDNFNNSGFRQETDFNGYLGVNNNNNCFQDMFGHHHHNDNVVDVGNNNISACNNNIVTNGSDHVQEFNEISKKRQATVADHMSETSSLNPSPQVSEITIQRKNSLRKGKRVKRNEEEEERKPKEVVHVRARRGQATDSHSLAERVRRGKINERLKCLQDIVPGCYKTMSMAVMLDEIINYVQSLQNQVEFLSMKLTAASTFYDFNEETDAIEKLQWAKAYEAKELEKVIRERYGEATNFQSTWPF